MLNGHKFECGYLDLNKHSEVVFSNCKFFFNVLICTWLVELQSWCVGCPGHFQLYLRRSLRLARLEKTNMADAADNVVENTQRSVCASSQERAGDDQLQVGIGCSATKPAGDTTMDIRKRPNATSPTKVPSYMCISFKDLEMCLGLLPYSMVDQLTIHSPSRLNGQRHLSNLLGV